MEMKEAQGTIQWVADECVGYLCTCGAKDALVVGIYEDSPAICPNCGKAYVLQQTNVVMEQRPQAQEPGNLG